MVLILRESLGQRAASNAVQVTLFHSPTDEPLSGRQIESQDGTNSARFRYLCKLVGQRSHLRDGNWILVSIMV